MEASRAYATHPHLAGSSEDELDAKTVLHFLQDELGIPRPPHFPIYKAGTDLSRNATLLLTTSDAPTGPTAWIDTYYPVMNTGLDRALEILDDSGKVTWAAELEEDGDPRDEDAHKYRDAIPAWHGLSCDGDVTGQLVYANYGRKEDYDELVAHGANLTGKIIIARYGANFRGLKVRVYFLVADISDADCRLKLLKNSVLPVCSSILIHGTTAMLLSRTNTHPTLRVHHEIQPQSKEEACNSYLPTQVTPRPQDIRLTRMQSAPKAQTSPRFPAYQYHGITESDYWKKLVSCIPRTRTERRFSVDK